MCIFGNKVLTASFIDLNGESSVTVNFSWDYEENASENDSVKI